MVDSGTTGTWVDETDIRPTLIYLTGLKDDYEHDGRVITEILTAPNRALAAPGVASLGACYKQLNSSVGQFGAFTLHAATAAIESSTPGDARYRVVDASLAGLDKLRDSLALRVKGELEAAAFGDQPIAGAGGQTVVCKSIIAGAAALAGACSVTTSRAAAPTLMSGRRRVVAARVSDNGPVKSQPREVVILGSTGSIGTQALDIIRRNPDRFRVVALAAGGGQPDLLARQAAEFGPAAVAVASPAAEAGVQSRLQHHYHLQPHRHPQPQVLSGPDAVSEVAAWPCDVVLNGVTGAAGLRPRWPRWTPAGCSPWPTRSR